MSTVELTYREVITVHVGNCLDPPHLTPPVCFNGLCLILWRASVKLAVRNMKLDSLVWKNYR